MRMVEGYRVYVDMDTKGSLMTQDRGENDDDSHWCRHLDPDVDDEMNIEWRRRMIEPCIS